MEVHCWSFQKLPGICLYATTHKGHIQLYHKVFYAQRPWNGQSQLLIPHAEIQQLGQQWQQFKLNQQTNRVSLVDRSGWTFLPAYEHGQPHLVSLLTPDGGNHVRTNFAQVSALKATSQQWDKLMDWTTGLEIRPVNVFTAYDPRITSLAERFGQASSVPATAGKNSARLSRTTKTERSSM